MKIYLIGDTDQGGVFSPTKAFSSEEDRMKYLSAQREIQRKFQLSSCDGIVDDTEEIELYDVNEAIREFREWAERKAAYNLEWRARRNNQQIRSDCNLIGIVSKIGFHDKDI